MRACLSTGHSHVWATLCGFERSGYDLFGSFSVSQMNWRGPEVSLATRAAPGIQGGLVRGLDVPALDKQVSFLHSATARPPATNYSISFLATRGHWNVFLRRAPPTPPNPSPTHPPLLLLPPIDHHPPPSNG